MPAPVNTSYTTDHPRFNGNRSVSNPNTYASFEAAEPATKPFPSDPMKDHWGGDYVPFSIDIYHSTSAEWFYESQTIDRDQMPSFAGGSMDDDWESSNWIWEKRYGDTFRFKVHFNPAPGQKLMASPVFDDITFVFITNQSRVLIWENGDSE